MLSNGLVSSVQANSKSNASSGLEGVLTNFLIKGLGQQMLNGDRVNVVQSKEEHPKLQALGFDYSTFDQTQTEQSQLFGFEIAFNVDIGADYEWPLYN